MGKQDNSMGGRFVTSFFKKKRGQSLVEFAIVAPLFLLLIFGVLDLGRFFFTKMTLEFAMREAGRFAITGNTLPPTNGVTMTRLASIQQIANKAAAGVGVVGISITSTPLVGGTASSTAGGPGDFVTVKLTKTVAMITPLIGKFLPDGAYTFSVSTTFKNEPFPASQTSL